MEYVAYEIIEGDRIIVDGNGDSNTILTLSHWPQSGTPQEFRADTSAEIVLNFLRSPRRAEFEAKTDIVSNNHFDEDGLMSVWAMTNPDSALELHEQVIAVATAGDFSRVTTPQSAQTVFAINKLASAALADGEDEYESLLPIVGELLRHPNRFEEFWHDDWQRLRSDFEQIDKGDVRITEYPEIDLSVIESPRPIDAMAICSRTDCLRYLTIFGEGFYKFQYRYESWVQVVSRTVRPRIDLHSLSTRLQQLESAQGSWKYGDTSDIMPSLEFVDFERNPTPSAIPRAQLIPEVIGFFEREQDNQSLQWSPYDTEEAGGCGIVFEQSEPQQPSTALHQLGRLNKRNAD